VLATTVAGLRTGHNQCEIRTDYRCKFAMRQPITDRLFLIIIMRKDSKCLPEESRRLIKREREREKFQSVIELLGNTNRWIS